MNTSIVEHISKLYINIYESYYPSANSIYPLYYFKLNTENLLHSSELLILYLTYQHFPSDILELYN